MNNWAWPGFNNYPAGNNVYGGVAAPFQQTPWAGASAYAQDLGPTPWKGRSKHASLHPILAVDTTLLRYDLRKKARSTILANAYYTNAQVSATIAPVMIMRLVSQDFPWTVDIKSTLPITVEFIWDALYAAMQEEIMDSEWGIIVCDKKLRATVEKAAKKRIEAEGQGSSKKMKRIDWLGENTCLKGLDRDEAFEKLRLLPGDKNSCPDTWLVKMCAP
ncbi:uncharacterized protein BT62DRAFT_938948 [Guyanagaster necrorhizus]|uniref:DUF6699 domain-containing protein n=1 Tax=Guyanagaster necrorhizus TaxID=856835 RepID=A0A9P7VF63_9AGAR|nr:uncharacterized protein BT62DRAFT_938948 [Guyanagaster necrorhizus MCA 3950]KAG7439457.1 hypothetical protein BT62DRAFT_938948 [Guyanagaster necrorhizus MCA 3950]